MCTFDSVAGAIISWSTAQKLGILPKCYLQPITNVSTVPTSGLSNGWSLSQHTIDQIMSTPKTPAVTIPTTEEIMAEFPSVFDGQVRTMPGEKFHISLTADARPFCVTAPRTIPFAYRDKLKKEIDLLESQDIITPITEPPEWCAPIVVTPKKNSDCIRMCVDLSKLNKFVRRERYPSTTPAEAVADITQSKAKYFTVFDALKGYHQCPLDEESQKLTTFITPFGRYKYFRAPYGISSISEHYNRRMDEAFASLDDFRKIVDDVIIFDSDLLKHMCTHHVRQALRCCQEKSISLNGEKFQFCQQQAHFAGFTLTPLGYSVSSNITDAIAQFPKPSSRTDLRSFFGLVNQLASSTKDIADTLAPLRPLLSTRNEFLWGKPQDEAFIQAKKVLTSSPTLAYFDTTKETCLHTDASTLGIGFVLLQKSTDGTKEWRIVQAGSRFLTDAESRYAVIELECLAVAWAIKKCNIFLAGMEHFTVITDHNPLIPILNTHRLDEIENPRLQRLRTRLMGYNFTTQWLKGSKNEAADALSRHPYHPPNQGDDLAEYEIDTSGGVVVTTQAPLIAELRASALTHENFHLQELRRHANDDTVYQTLKDTILSGFPNQKSSLPDHLKAFWSVKDNLSMEDDLIVYDCRLFIPSTLRATMLSRLHDAHQGISRSQARARLTLYWPGIDQDIDNFVQGCRFCQDHLPSNIKEPLISKPIPDRPFQQIAVDFGYYGGQQFLIIVDCMTNWPDIIDMGKDTTTPKLVAALRDHFCHTAVPDVLWSDGGPQFTSSHLAEFLTTWGVSHITSSPHYPQSNGKVEATVKSMKKLISASWTGRSVDWNILSRSLLQYRNTPCRKDGQSPAQKLFGHPVQDTLPAHHRSFAPEWQKSVQEAEKAAMETQIQLQQSYNQHAHELSTLQVGNHVAIQNPSSRMWGICGVITALGPFRRYFVKTESGCVLVRNCRFLHKRSPLSVAAPADDTSTHILAPSNAIEPRRSARTKTAPNRLSKDPTWLFSSSDSQAKELGGEV